MADSVQTRMGSALPAALPSSGSAQPPATLPWSASPLQAHPGAAAPDAPVAAASGAQDAPVVAAGVAASGVLAQGVKRKTVNKNWHLNEFNRLAVLEYLRRRLKIPRVESEPVPDTLPYTEEDPQPW